MPGLSFTAIDFETANSDRASVCAVGLTRVRDGQVVDEYTTLVLPPTGTDSFHPRNTAIHGLGPADVASAPAWDVVFGAVMDFVGDDPLVAHNAPFDRSVMTRACGLFDLDWPGNTWHDTLRAARAVLTLASYSLPVVARALSLPEAPHHDAGQDARQAALLAVALTRTVGGTSLTDLFGNLGAVTAALRPRDKVPSGDFSALNGDRPLDGELVAFTGTLRTTTRAEAMALVAGLGGTGQQSVTKKTTMVVTGDFDPHTFRPGTTLSGKLAKAQQLAASGQPIEILAEDEFLARLDVTREEIEYATRAQRAEARSGWLPQYVVEQGRALAGRPLAYNAWMREALRHPRGRASTDDTCVRCDDPLTDDSYWMFLERHVCGADCNQVLKWTARRAWDAENLQRPAAPAYTAS